MKNIVQILAFRDPDNWKLLAPCLWAALIEIENFYNLDAHRVQCARYILSPAGSGWLQEYSSVSSPPDAPSYGPQTSDDTFWSALQGKFRRTIHQGKLAEAIRGLLPPQHKDSFFTIVTDREIEPPPEWRYIIWDEVPNGAVISTAPVDPDYWRDRTTNRAAAIKHRVRTAGMCVFGSELGLQRCDNPRCFLFSDVGSTDVLDTMLALGEEHNWWQLAGLGYPPRPKDPNQIQSPVPVILPEQEEAPGMPDPLGLGSEWNTYE